VLNGIKKRQVGFFRVVVKKPDPKKPTQFLLKAVVIDTLVDLEI